MDEIMEDDPAPAAAGGSGAGREDRGGGDARARKYRKLSQLEHVLLRPGMYIGDTNVATGPMFLLHADEGGALRMECKRDVACVPALRTLANEIFTNALDASIKDATVTSIDVYITPDAIGVRNNGAGMPVGVHPEYGAPVPEIVFGHLNSGSNFDDREDRVVAGLHGLGVKLCNIFSTEFTVSVRDAATGSVYEQRWRDQMRVAEPPTVKTRAAPKPGFVDVLFRPVPSLLAPHGAIADDVRGVLAARVLDVALAAPARVKVKLNGVLLPATNLKRYARLFSPDGFLAVDDANEHWQVAVAACADGAQVRALVNGVSAPAGKHVEHVESKLYAAVIAKAAAKRGNKGVDLKPRALKSRLRLFVVARVADPQFDSQTKENCVGMKFLSRYEPSDAFVAKIADSEVVAAAAEEARAREGKKLSSATDGRKTERVNVPKLQDATFAGTKRSGEASLFLVEGDSARTFAMAGLGALGHDRYGVFPLRGVLLNTREATVKQLIENEEVKHLKTILGLREGHTHAGGEGLRYGSVIALTDADADGTHIRGLILNFIHHKWPALAASGFVRVLQTPVVRATRGSEVVDFVNLAEVNHWAATDAARGFKLRYYKGLGSWTPADAKKLLKDARPIRFVAAPGEQGVAAAQEAIELAFAKDKKEDRKSLILLNVASPPVPDYSRDMTIPDYVRRDWVNFAMYNVERSIPSVLDGLKTSQRKVLWTVIKKNHLTAAQLVKVPVLCGEVMSFTQYLHGEASLNGAIVNMAQDFVGATNLNLLYPNGMFGTRIKNGADASAPRYITTYGTPLLRFVFRAEDDDLYALAKEEGDDVEPVAMWPVLPTLLLTGAAAIATGFSTYVPAFAPADVLANVRRAIAGEPLQSMAPFYRGFEGKIAPDGKGGWTATGVVVRGAGAGQWVVTELPVGQRAPSFNDYDEWLKSDKCAADCEKNLSTDTHARFLVCFPPDAQPADEAAAVAALKLTCGITTTNMHAFAPDGRIKKYASAEEIIEEWVPWRLARYEARRLRLIANSEAQLVKTTNTLRFVEAVIARQIVVQDHEETPLCALLEAGGYAKLKDGFDYLLALQTRTFTRDRAERLRREAAAAQEALERLRATTARQLWEADLDALQSKDPERFAA